MPGAYFKTKSPTQHRHPRCEDDLRAHRPWTRPRWSTSYWALFDHVAIRFERFSQFNYRYILANKGPKIKNLYNKFALSR